MATTCGAGQRLVNGVCVPIGMQSGLGAPNQKREYVPFPKQQGPENMQTQQVDPFAQAFSNIGQAASATTAQNIAASEQTLASQQERLNEQLAQQRRDYLNTRQALQKDTFMRGRNVLANLANRGLATSGLQQLGDVQRAVATGQQMSGLAEAFNNARTNLNQQLSDYATRQQQFAAQQRTGLQEQLANIDLQQAQVSQAQKDRTLGLNEDLIAFLQTPGLTQAQIDEGIRIYTQAGANLSQAPTTGAPTDTQNQMVSAFAQQAYAPTTQDYITSYKAMNRGSSGEDKKFEQYVAKSELLSSPEQQYATIRNEIFARREEAPTMTQLKEFGDSTLNDSFILEWSDGTKHTVKAKDLIAMVMNGDVKLNKTTADLLKPKSALFNIGQEDDAFTKAFRTWLDKNGF